MFPVAAFCRAGNGRACRLLDVLLYSLIRGPHTWRVRPGDEVGLPNFPFESLEHETQIGRI